jgi:hypothetical protein
MPYASASGGADHARRTGRPAGFSSGGAERGDMTRLRATYPLVVIAPGSARPDRVRTSSPLRGHLGDRP